MEVLKGSEKGNASKEERKERGNYIRNGHYGDFAETSGKDCDILNEKIKNCYGSVLSIKNRPVCMLVKKLFAKAIDKGLKKLRRDSEAPGASKEPNLP